LCPRGGFGGMLFNQASYWDFKSLDWVIALSETLFVINYFIVLFRKHLISYNVAKTFDMLRRVSNPQFSTSQNLTFKFCR